MRTDPTEVRARAPGRANLIGEHTDYNDGFVLPVALELTTTVRGRRSDRVRLRSEGHRGVAEVDLRDGSGRADGWARSVTAVVRAMLEAGVTIEGVEGTISSTVPSGTGLSSSAALEVAVAMALLAQPMEPHELARICQRAENVHVGVRTGIMDQLVSVAASAGSALFIDCRSLETADVPVPADLAILVIDSGQRRALTDGDYNRRRAECEEAARLLGVGSLREVDASALDELRLPEPLGRRVRHVATENARTLATVEALRTGRRELLGELFAASHASLARDFEVSTPSLDALVEIAVITDGVVAARMTGAGFGGCTINLVERSAAERVARAIVERYAASGRTARWWISAPGPGAFELAGRA